jgi:glycosyltransferase involved in cell wall biosynthesis
MAAQTILIFTTTKSAAGVAQFNEVIAADLLNAGYATIIAQPAELDYRARVEFCSTAARRYFTRDPYDDVLAFGDDKFLAARVLAETRPDLVVFSTGVHPLTNVAAMQTASFLGIPYVIIDALVARSVFEWNDKTIELAAKLYRNARAVIVQSQENLDSLRQFLRLSDDTGMIIHCGRPDIYFEPINQDRRAERRRQLGIPDDGVLCFTAAKMEQVKGHTIQIEAMRRLKEGAAWDKLYFAWAGDGDQQEHLKSELHALGVLDKVHLLGHQTDITAWLDASDCFVLSSHIEAIPLSIMEAMAKGLPVVATAVGGVPEALGDSGFLIARPREGERTITDLVAALETLAGDADLRRRKGAEGRTRAVTMFRQQRMIEDYRAVFEISMS